MSPQPTTVPTLAPTMLPSVDRVMAGTMNYSNVSTVPHNVDEFVLAMNIATSDGHNVAYNNFNFWQSTSVTGGSTTDATRAFFEDYKNPYAFSFFEAGYILIVVHQNGTARGWRMWSLVSAKRPLQDYFGGDNQVNTCWNIKTETLTDRFTCNNLANVSVDGNVGSLSPAEPIVYNYGDNDALYTNVAGANDYNRLSTACYPTDNEGWGLGTTYPQPISKDYL